MPINQTNEFGNITLSDNALATLVGSTVCECYGVVGMSSQTIVDGINELLGKENYSKGVVIRYKDNVLSVDLHVVLISGVKIAEVVSEIQKRVKYSVEKTLNIDVLDVNIIIEGVKVI